MSEHPTVIKFPGLFKEKGKFVYKNYTAEHAIAGDTDSCYMRLPFVKEGMSNEEVCEIADEIGAHANDLFPDFIKEAFNIPESRKDVIQTDREVVSDKSLFVTKKRYAAHIINKEGKWTDEMKIMGLEIRKSNTPAILKRFLQTIVDKALDDYDADQMSQLVREMRKEYMDTPFHEIATPMGCNTLKAAQQQVAETGSMHGLHYSARAALFYNSMCSERDQPVRPGDKIALVYIKHPQSKYVGYPVDAPHLPDFMKDIVIDYKTQWSKAEKTINGYLQSMGFDLSSRKKDIKRNLFGFK